MRVAVGVGAGESVPSGRVGRADVVGMVAFADADEVAAVLSVAHVEIVCVVVDESEELTEAVRHVVADELGHGDDECVEDTDAVIDTEPVMSDVFEGDDETDGELDTEGQPERLALIVTEPLPDDDAETVGLCDCEPVTETEPVSEPLCVDVELTEAQPDGDAEMEYVELTVCVGGLSQGDTVLLCETDVDAVE